MNTLSIEQHSGLAVVRLNRPDKKNAMSFEMMRELVQAAKQLKADRRLRTVILHGSGNSFCAGIDLADLKNPANRKTVLWELAKPCRSLFQNAALAWRDLPVPVIAAVEGHAVGAGLQLALAADYAFTTADSRWAIREAHWGIIPDMGISVSARGKVRSDILAELIFSARLFSGEAAQQYGFAAALSTQPFESALALAEQLASRSPDALLAAKRITHTLYGCEWLPLMREKIWQLKLLAGKNQALAVRKDSQPETAFKPRQYR
ncbi:crotonase/enoyl-CoA hydratase family protein [Uruburuella testudinis]|uniref:Crotonase/enoyl-CoA hydratase family protein n=1 Tax=Uruburuella testudinis TaxID=1282863 RepID=A0ABY4DTI1_9NEIS|nr:crotonase/enoyl-CoA hydratase family protein [Uruburuella testudinis]UOO82345.1 crotonase/enoyl-CoA hydratase family protein [Uruburuella testudinis]